MIPVLFILCGGQSNGVEPLCSSAAAEFQRLAPATIVRSYTWAKPGACYSDLKRGTAPYAAMLARVRQEVAANPDVAVRAVSTWVHGECDWRLPDAGASYATKLRELGADLQADLAAITGQAAWPRTLYTDQLQDGGLVALAQFEVARELGPVALVGPRYQYEFPPDASGLRFHLTEQGRRDHGVLFARAIWADHSTDAGWYPLQPAVVRKTGPQTVEVLLVVPRLPLVIDNALGARHVGGLELVDGGGAAIVGLQVWPVWGVLTARLVVTVDRPLAPNARLGAAAVVVNPRTPAYPPVTNIRDSAGNWLVSFDEVIP